MRRVLFSDGEGLTHGDLNMLGQLADRASYRALRAQMQTAVDAVGADSPLLVRGADPSHSGTGTRTITLTNSLWCAAEDNPPAAADDVPEVYFGDIAGANYVLDANTSGSVWRRDILQAKINAESNTGSESRTFEDAATRQLTTTTTNKRRVRTVTISVKKGADQTSEALADANEPAPDSGFVKIFSFLVDNTGACAAAKRKRYTVGFLRRTRIIHPSSGIAAAATVGFNATERFMTLGSAGAKIWLPADIPLGRRLRGLKVRVARVVTATADIARLQLLKLETAGSSSVETVLATASSSGDAFQNLDAGNLDEAGASFTSFVAELDLTTFASGMAVLAMEVTDD